MKAWNPIAARMLLLAAFGQPAVVLAADDTFFYEQVVPIFQRRCIGCHSDSDPKGEFSVESAAGAFDSQFIEPGDIEGSRIIEVITPVDGEAEMPKNADPMTEAEIATIRKWVESGAKWPTGVSVSAAAVEDFDWWSLKPLRRPDVPKVHATDLRNPIDHFVRAKLAEQSLVPSKEASRQTLIRRLYFDLIGLPPTSERVEQFVTDADPQTYEKLVDELLESRHYGERWARHWLDVVHYADTHGYDKDKLRPNAWPYRDFVIRAFNEDRPYSKFVKQQIAGDVLWPDTFDGITGTGFIAAGPWDFIGHAEVPESKIDGRIARHLDRDDMVSSTMNTFTSTTVQCARCHNHKFDPITQEHYYSLQTIFAALDRADRPFDRDPNIAKRRAKLKSRQSELTDRKAKIQTKIAELGGDQLVGLDERIASLRKQASSKKTKPEFGYHSKTSSTDDAAKWVQIDLGQPTEIDEVVLFAAHDNFGGIGAGFGFPLRYRVEASNDEKFESGVELIVDETNRDAVNPGIAETRIAGSATARFVRVTATKLFHRVDSYIFALGELQVWSNGKNAARGRPVTSLDSIEAPTRWRRTNLVDGYYYDESQSKELAAELSTAVAQRESLLRRVVPQEQQRLLEETEHALTQVTQEISAMPKEEMVYAGTIHHGSGAFQGTGANGGRPRTIHTLHRGDILQPRGEAKPGRFPLSPKDADSETWRFQLPADHDEGDRRLALANWIVDEENPLTWRSIVNRVWHYHFGRGIVDSPNDFGRMGGTPSHPDLLDWLAVEFRDGGQSLKALHRMIVTSAVYRQESGNHEANAAIDGGNRFLWRMNRRRLSAEEVRDAVLQVSGKLNTDMYGPGMQLFVLERPEHSPHYEYHKHDPDDPKSHRRAVYRFIVRSQPDPFMTTLDCADSSQSVPARIETLTALQALSLLNNRFMLSMSKHFAQSLEKQTKEQAEQHDDAIASQIGLAYRRAMGSDATPSQHRDLVAYANEFGLANTCRLIFNLNEFVFID